MAARPTKGFKVDAGGYCPDMALLNKGLSSSENNVHDIILFVIFMLISAVIKKKIFDDKN